MDRRAPYLIVALAAMAGFIIWLFAQMTRTPRSTRWALTIGACALLLAVTLGIVMAWDRRKNSDSAE